MTGAAAELAKAWFENSPFISEMGLKLVAMEPDRATVEMPFEGKLDGRAHGQLPGRRRGRDADRRVQGDAARQDDVLLPRRGDRR